jgi:hypothetical protein
MNCPTEVNANKNGMFSFVTMKTSQKLFSPMDLSFIEATTKQHKHKVNGFI